MSIASTDRTAERQPGNSRCGVIRCGGKKLIQPLRRFFSTLGFEEGGGGRQVRLRRYALREQGSYREDRQYQDRCNSAHC